MDKKYAIIIGIILAIFLISSSYAILTGDDVNSTNANDVPKDINNVTANKSVSVENCTVDKSIYADKSVDKSIYVDKSVDIESGISTSSAIVGVNPPADKIYTVDGKTYFEAYDGNGNKYAGEINVGHHVSSFIDENGDEILVISDNSPDIHSEKYNLNKEFYSRFNLSSDIYA